MQILHSPRLSTICAPRTAISKPLLKPSKNSALSLHQIPTSFFPSLHFSPKKPSLPDEKFTVKSSSYGPDEVPVDEDFIKKFGPKESEYVSREEGRRRNWIEYGWAPWEEILTPEAEFARRAIDEGEEVPLTTPEAVEAFKMLRPSYVKKKIEEMGITEDEYYAKQFEIKGEKLEPLETYWDGPLVVTHVAPRDWPPRGWEVDRNELEFIRESHKMLAQRVTTEELENAINGGGGEVKMNLDRYEVFLKQYYDWVEHNRDRLEEESYKYDQDYHPGRRKRGKDYNKDMFELPYYYPGQICGGKVTTLHLYQGAFVDIGGVYEGWVPIKGNDWYWLRQYIKVGMQVTVEILAKRDPYRFRFPIELRFVDPNIDHLIFNRFDYPPIFFRDEDTNPDEIRRDCGRPPLPRKDPGIKWEEEPLLSNHPYVDKLWQIHVAEQMFVDDIEANPEKYEGKKLSELTDEEEFDEEKSMEFTKGVIGNVVLPKVILKTSVRELDLEAAFAERQLNNRLQKAAEARGEVFKVEKLRRNHEMDEYDLIHWRRSFEEREAFLRDISCRQALGLPLEEPGRYVDASHFGDQYDPSSPLYRYDYFGEPKNSEKSKQMRRRDSHNASIVGKGTVWYEMSYEEAIKQQTEREAREREKAKQDAEKEKEKERKDEDDDSDWDDFDYSILSDVNADFVNDPHVNGTQSSRMSDEGLQKYINLKQPAACTSDCKTRTAVAPWAQCS